MSERHYHKRLATGIALIAAAAFMAVLPAAIRTFRAGHIRNAEYHAAGRPAVVAPVLPSTGTISVNDAEPDELCELYGIGETLAGLIVQERGENGRYYYPEDLTQVKGIGLKKLEGFRDMIDLN